MQETTITSGKNIPHIDPTLSVWGWEIPVYLYLGGLVAGILFFSALYYIRGKEDEYPTMVRFAPLFAPILLGLGLFALFLDLEYKLHVFRFYTNIRLESPMSWGSWTLAVIFPLSLVWAALHLEKVFPSFSWPTPWLGKTILWLGRFARPIAWILMVYSVILGIYTGILLSAFNARPVWNSAILGPLFLASGLSTGLAFNLLFARKKEEKHLLGRIDLMVISVELFLIIHFFMGFLASTEIHIYAAKLFLGGPYTAPFWVFVIGLGLLLPGLIEIFELKGRVAASKIPALLVLAGGFMLRVIMVQAGQFSQW